MVSKVAKLDAGLENASRELTDKLLSSTRAEGSIATHRAGHA